MSKNIVPRYKMPVNVIVKTDKLHDGKVVITAKDGVYELHLGEQLIATCEYAKRLSDWAFENGVFSVRHNYHLGLSDWEP